MGITYWEKYTPIVDWVSARFLLVLFEIAGLDNRAICFCPFLTTRNA